MHGIEVQTETEKETKKLEHYDFNQAYLFQFIGNTKACPFDSSNLTMYKQYPLGINQLLKMARRVTMLQYSFQNTGIFY